jgi:EAL and modified HD-GYP domain-containing signal transduction protein
MAAQVTVDSMLGISPEAVTDGLPAFINASRDMLLSGVLEALDPARIVVEVLETVPPDEEVMQACRRLVGMGHTLALDDWFENDPRIPLIPLSAIVKVVVLDRTPDAAAALLEPFQGRNVRRLAERVETAEVHEACVQAGFEWFQGYFYRRPELVRQPDLRPDQILIVQAMNLVQDDAMPDRGIGAFFKRDPTLAYKLVRMANAAPMGVREIESVEHAVSVVGRAALFRWLGLLLVASFNRASCVKQELLREALVRARQCELLAGTSGARQSGHLFLVGLFSRIEVLLGVQLSRVLDRVVLPAPVTAVLTRREGPYAPVLAVAEAYEDSRWDEIPELADAAGLPAARVPASYRDALAWAIQVSRTI